MVCMDCTRCMCDNVRREKLCRIVFVFMGKRKGCSGLSRHCMQGVVSSKCGADVQVFFCVSKWPGATVT